MLAAAVPRMMSRGGAPMYGVEWTEPTKITGIHVFSTPMVYAEIKNVTVFGLASTFTPKYSKLR